MSVLTWNYKYHRVIDRILNTANNLILEKTRSWIALAIVYINNGGRWYCSCSEGQGLATKRPQRKLNLGIKCTPNNTAMSWHCAGIIDSAPVINSLRNRKDKRYSWVCSLTTTITITRNLLARSTRLSLKKYPLYTTRLLHRVSIYLAINDDSRGRFNLFTYMYMCVYTRIYMSNCTIEITFIVKLK